MALRKHLEGLGLVFARVLRLSGVEDLVHQRERGKGPGEVSLHGFDLILVEEREHIWGIGSLRDGLLSPSGEVETEHVRERNDHTAKVSSSLRGERSGRNARETTRVINHSPKDLTSLPESVVGRVRSEHEEERERSTGERVSDGSEVEEVLGVVVEPGGSDHSQQYVKSKVARDSLEDVRLQEEEGPDVFEPIRGRVPRSRLNGRGLSREALRSPPKRSQRVLLKRLGGRTATQSRLHKSG
mmetsp:Transcript_16973/g.32196  ORF Transcript_16973/g.32196 Transcript_16973/m.32196 type:complete len:242 (-) Transcript_16973:197-922(-)